MTAVAKSWEAGTKCRGGDAHGHAPLGEPPRLEVVAPIEVDDGCVPSAPDVAPCGDPSRDEAGSRDGLVAHGPERAHPAARDRRRP